MKQTLLFLIFFAPMMLQAQFALEVEPNPTVETLQVDLTNDWAEPILHGKVTNVAADPINLRWLLVVEEAPVEWKYKVCDNTQCYSTQVTSNVDPALNLNIPVTLAENDTTLLDFHILPKGVAGTMKAKIHLTPAEDFDNIIASAEYDITIEGFTSVSEAEKASIKLYPNPTSDYITLNENSIVDELVVYNVIGQPVRSFEAENGLNYNISDLPNGLYLVSLLDKEKDIIKTLRVSKDSLRP